MAGRRLRLTRQCFLLHRWLGLAAGLLLIVIGLSGSVLVFHGELDDLLFPGLHRVVPQGERLPLDTLYERAQAAHPEAWGLRFRHLRPEEPTRSVQMSLYRGTEVDAAEWFYLYIDPYSGRILGLQNADAQRGFRHSPLNWLLWLHFSLLGGKIGQLLVGLLSLAFVGSLLTGLVVYRKKILPVLLCRVRVSFRDRPTALSGLHRVVGVWALLLNLLLGVTGFWMMRYVFTADFYAESQTDSRPAPTPAFSFDRVLADVRRQYPRFIPHWTSPVPTDGQVLVLGGALAGQSAVFAQNSTIHYHVGQNRIADTDLLDDRRLPGKLDAAVTQLHFGAYGGLPVKLIYTVGGLTAPLLSVTGFVLWWLKRHRGRGITRLGQALGQAGSHSPLPPISGGEGRAPQGSMNGRK